MIISSQSRWRTCPYCNQGTPHVYGSARIPCCDAIFKSQHGLCPFFHCSWLRGRCLTKGREWFLLPSSITERAGSSQCKKKKKDTNSSRRSLYVAFKWMGEKTLSFRMSERKYFTVYLMAIHSFVFILVIYTVVSCADVQEIFPSSLGCFMSSIPLQ